MFKNLVTITSNLVKNKYYASYKLCSTRKSQTGSEQGWANDDNFYLSELSL